MTSPLRYVALGDSYTIGTGVRAAERFPDQLVAAVAAATPDEPPLQLVANLGVNGYTTADLIRDELPAVAGLMPHLVTLLIGVNDVAQGVAVEAYAANVAVILDAILAQVPSRRLVTIATPDYTVTPAGAGYGDPSARSAAIGLANSIMSGLAQERGATFVDIVDISLQAATVRTLVAGDGLHPSGVQYARWVERIAPAVEAALAD